MVRVAVDQSPERTAIAIVLAVLLMPAAAFLVTQIDTVRDDVKRAVAWLLVAAMFGLPILIWRSRRTIVVDADARTVTLGRGSSIGFDELAGVTVESEERTISNPNGGSVTSTIWKAVLQRADGRLAMSRRSGLSSALFGTGQKSSVFEHVHATRVVAIASVVGRALGLPVIVDGEDIFSDYRSRVRGAPRVAPSEPPKQLSALEVSGETLQVTWRVSGVVTILVVGLFIVAAGGFVAFIPTIAGDPMMWQLTAPAVALTGLGLFALVRSSGHGTYRLTADPSGLTYAPARGSTQTTQLDDIQVLLSTDLGLAVITAEAAYTVRLAKGNASWLEQRIEAHWRTTP